MRWIGLCEKIMKNLFELIPFINLYPVWAQAIMFMCAIVIASILLFVPRKAPPPKESKISVSVEHPLQAKPILDIKLSMEKMLNLKNSGNVPLKDIKVFATKYLLNEKAFIEKRIEIENINKVGGPLHEIQNLDVRKEENIGLTQKPFLKFFDNPGKGENEPILTYFCFRFSYTSSLTNEKHIFYKVTSGIKNFPSWVDNPEHTAYGGGTSYDFMFEIPNKIINNQKKIYNESKT